MSSKLAHKAQIKDRKYNNWVKGGLALKYFKYGISDFADEIARDQHDRILQNLGLSPGTTCNLCKLETLKPLHTRPLQKIKQCPIGQRNCNCLLSNTSGCSNNICDFIYDEIVKSHGKFQPNWKNTDITKWTTHPWEIAKCFINVPGYDRTQSAKDTDVVGLLHLFINCIFFQGRFSCDINLLDKIREWRNTVFHSPSMELENNQLEDEIKDIIQVLHNTKELKAIQCSMRAVQNLNNLQRENFIITTETEAEVCREALASFTQATNELKQLHDYAEKEIDLKKDEAIKNIQETAETSNTKLQSEVSELRKRVDNHEEEIRELEKNLKKIKKGLKNLKQAKGYQMKHLQEIDHIIQLSEELVRFYNEKESMLPASPLVEEHVVPLVRLYVQPPILEFIKPNAFGQGKKTTEKVSISSYKQLFFGYEYTPIHTYKNIYVEADAGYGKTCFTKKLAMTWCLAQNSNKTGISDNQQLDVGTLKHFDLLFLLHLRDFHGDMCLLDDLVFKFVSKNLPKKEGFSKVFIRRILENRHCLVILDGLDEWVHPESCPQTPEIPHNNYRERCTLLTTTRPWKLSTIGLTPNLIDRHIQISQLDEKTYKELKLNAVKILSENSGARMPDLNDFDKKLSSVKLGDIHLIPYILLQLISIWFDGFSIDKSKCETYCNTIELTLQRSLKKKCVPVLPSGNTDCHVAVPNCMTQNTLCQQYISVLLKLGTLAFYTLFQEIKDSKLVIESTTVLRFLTQQELEFCLKIGLLSQTKDSSNVSVKQYNVFFQHKSVQEFMAALYITSDWQNKNIKLTIVEVCSSLSNMLELENLFVFVCGMNPLAYECIFDELQKIVDLDSVARRYTCRNDIVKCGDRRTIVFFQSMHVQCLQESMRNGNKGCASSLYVLLDDIHIDLTSLKTIIHFNGAVKSLQLIHPNMFLAFMQTLDTGVFTSLETLRVEDNENEPVWLADILHISARTLNCLKLSLGYGSSLSDINILALTGLKSLQSLDLYWIYMFHSNLECLFAFISNTTTLTQLALEMIYCLDHEDHYCRDCDITLDLHRLNKLKILHLPIVPCRELRVNHTCLEKLMFRTREEKMTAYASAAFWKDLQGASALTSLTLYWLTSSQEMKQTIPTLIQLKYLELEWIDIKDAIPHFSSAMSNLERVQLHAVTMSSAAWLELFLSVGALPRIINVKLSLITMASQGWRDLLLSVSSLPETVTVELFKCMGPSRDEWQAIVDIIRSSPTLSLLCAYIESDS